MNRRKKDIKIAVIAGARPNFMKVMPISKALSINRINHFIINTGQHFDKEMSFDILEEFGIKPKYNLKAVNTSPVSQISDILFKLEKAFIKERPDLVIVVGDVNSTLAGAIAAKKMNIKLAHVEAGLRSHNFKMPEELNRILTDRMSDYLFVTAEEGIVNLKKEGIESSIHYVGNIMIDTLRMMLPRVKSIREKFYFCTLHRGENVDNIKIFNQILDALEIISHDSKIYLPLHPRTKLRAHELGLAERLNIIFTLMPPLSYTESIFYQKNAQLVLTDSGGIQEETSYLGVPCLTLRTETERPITVKQGTNSIGGVTEESILKVYKNKKLGKIKTKIPLWDGQAAGRIVKIIKQEIIHG